MKSLSFIVSDAEQHFLALDQLEEVGSKENHFLIDPVRRNNAHAIALASLKMDPDTIFLVFVNYLTSVFGIDYSKSQCTKKHLSPATLYYSRNGDKSILSLEC